jgi:hypothetical protein
MPATSTTNCDFSNPVYWNKNNSALTPVGSDLSTGDSFQFSSSTCYTTYGPTNSSTAPSYAGGFSYGEIVNSVFVFLILSVSLLLAFRLYFGRIRVKSHTIRKKKTTTD